MSNVSAMYDKMSLSVATPFQTWETPSTGSVTVCCTSSYFIFPKAGQSPLTSLWLAQMPLNGMPSSKCSRRIVWTNQPWLQCRDHMSKWYLAGTMLPYFLDSHWFWMDKGGQLHWYQLSPFAHTVAYDQIEYPKHINEFSVWFLLFIVSVYIASW